MSKKMYVIINGEYSDAHPIGVAEDEKIAEAFAKLHDSCVDEVDFIDDATVVAEAKKYVKCFPFSLRRTKKWEFVGRYDPQLRLKELVKSNVEFQLLPRDSWDKPEVTDRGKLFVYNDDFKKARKIANDYVAKKNAEEQGL